MVRHLAAWVVLITVSILLMVGLGACNISDDTAPDGPECVEDEDCAQGVCEANECIECREASDCSGDEQCEASECISGCEGFDCGEGGSCVEDDQAQISCECDEDSVVVGEICEPCDCEVANGTGECTTDGSCSIASCDEGYFTEDEDPGTGCECAPTDHPDPVGFEDGNCDGLDGDFDRAIFVSTFGDDDNDGIRTRPVETIGRAIELATDDEQKDQIYIAEGVYEEQVVLSEPISLFGGYFDAGNGDWERGEEYETVISGVGVDNGHRPVVIEGVEEPVELQLLRVEADDAQLLSIGPLGLSESAALDMSSVGISAQEVEELVLSHVEVVAGDGRVGGSGGFGLVGIDGSDGERGQESPVVDDPDHEGRGGEQSCDGEDVGGGDGGLGGSVDGPSDSGDDGRGQAPGDGGGGGDLGGDAGCDGNGTPGDGDQGEAGTDGDDGADGESLDGELMIEVGDRAFYTGVSGESGEDGEPGSGGGGGGGAGGYDWELCIFDGCNCSVLPAGGGGGGGSGGCGGSPGGGGGWGGASIAVMAYETPLVLEASELMTGDGGDGGQGGAGSTGGTGGAGGEGTEVDLTIDGVEKGMGGDGGDGGTGGTGGGGSGGMGGASVGIMSRGAEVSIDEFTTFDLGEVGEGGSGAGEDNDGPDGVRSNVFEIEE